MSFVPMHAIYTILILLKQCHKETKYKLSNTYYKIKICTNIKNTFGMYVPKLRIWILLLHTMDPER